MDNYDAKAIELLMDSMNQGIVYVDAAQKIQICNRKAKEITGIVIDTHASHDAGQITEGYSWEELNFCKSLTIR